MYSVTRSLIGLGFTVLVGLGPAAAAGEARQVRVESLFPRQAPRGQSTVLNLAVPSRDPVQAAELSPAQGVTVAGLKAGDNFQGALTWWEVTLEVAPDAPAGDRSLVLVMPKGRTLPIAVTIPPHVPSIAGLLATLPEGRPTAVEVQFDATDASGDLGSTPYVWFTIGCGSDLVPGVVRGGGAPRDRTTAVIRASLPRPRVAAAGAGTCTLRLRLADAGGSESNTVTTTVAITQ
ncbi:MAG: hypothetical protein HY824_15290 [Acidobacteria bacterium]|nr:hypothetical protein [Acidobacteriota bacterium]